MIYFSSPRLLMLIILYRFYVIKREVIWIFSQAKYYIMLILLDRIQLLAYG
jgi:hypothetical protein